VHNYKPSLSNGIKIVSEFKPLNGDLVFTTLSFKSVTDKKQKITSNVFTPSLVERKTRTRHDNKEDIFFALQKLFGSNIVLPLGGAKN